MKVLFVTHFYEPSEGGAATRLTHLARFLQTHGHQVTVLTSMPHYPKGEIEPEYRGRLFKVEDRDGIRIIYTWLWITPGARVMQRLLSQLSFLLIGAIRGLFLPRPDVVFIEYQPMFTGVLGRFIARLKRAPYVLNVSDLWPEFMLHVGGLKETDTSYRIAKAIVDGGYRGAKVITTMSPAWSETIVGYLGGDDSKVRTILRGTNIDVFKPIADTSAFREKYQLGDKKIVSFIGTFATQYDFKVMLDTVKALQHRDDVLFMMVGTGSQYEDVLKLIHQGELPNLRLIEWIPYEEIFEAWNVSALAYWAMHGGALYRGTIPAKLFEAFACGIPVAVAHGGHVTRILAESGGGFSVEPGDTQGLVKIIERLLDDDNLRQQCSQKAREYALKEYDFNVASTRYETALKDAIAAYQR